MKYFTDLEVEVDGRIEGTYLFMHGKKYKIREATATGFNVMEVQK
jgi:hypothetical protein